MSNVISLIFNLILVFSSTCASAELPLNFQQQWRGTRTKLARILTTEFRIAKQNPAAAELRLSRTVQKLVAINRRIEKSPLRNELYYPRTESLGAEVLAFVAYGALDDALRDAWPEVESERKNLLFYLAEFSRQVSYDTANPSSDMRRAAEHGWERREKTIGRSLLGFAWISPIASQVLIYGGWVESGTEVLLATGLGFAGFLGPMWLSFGRPLSIPFNFIGVHLQDCEGALLRLGEPARARTVNPERASEIPPLIEHLIQN